MADSEAVKLEPDSAIVFNKHGGVAPIGTTLSLTNTSQAVDVLYRIQTTSPATYRVRPSHGRIPSGGKVEVQIVMVTEPTKADKFLVKYVTVAHSLPSGDFMSQFQEAQASCQERRLRVSVVEGGDSGLAAVHEDKRGEDNETGNGIGNGKEGSEAGREETSSMRRTGSMASVASMAGSIRSSSGAEPSATVISSAVPTLGSPSMSKATNSSHSSLNLDPQQYEEMQRELREARAKIQMLIANNQELTKALDDAKQARQRNVPHDTAEAASHPATKLDRGISEKELNSLISAQSGFPPVLVILIAIFAFLVGLLF